MDLSSIGAVNGLESGVHQAIHNLKVLQQHSDADQGRSHYGVV